MFLHHMATFSSSRSITYGVSSSFIVFLNAAHGRQPQIVSYLVIKFASITHFVFLFLFFFTVYSLYIYSFLTELFSA